MKRQKELKRQQKQMEKAEKKRLKDAPETDDQGEVVEGDVDPGSGEDAP